MLNVGVNGDILPARVGVATAASTPRGPAPARNIPPGTAGERPCGRPARASRLAILATIVAATLPAACSGPVPPPPGQRPPPADVPAPQVAVVQAQAAMLPAFPGAEGWGAAALNACRSKPVEVLSVTNTNTQGPGSLSHAVDNARSDRFTIIVFRTGGRIVAPPGGIRLASGCVYIAGQTAPGDGVVIEGRGTGFWFRGYGRDLSDVVIRYLRFRGRHGQTRNNLVVARGERIILDHMSFSWTDNFLLALMRYGGLAWSGPISDVSVQRSILAEAFATHPTAFVIGGSHTLRTATSIGVTNISIQGNLFAHNSHRNPMLAADNAAVVNNVIYNWRLGAGMMQRRGTVDWINNYVKAGPMTKSRFRFAVNPYCNSAGGDFSIYASGNTGSAAGDQIGDNWSDDTRQVACYYSSGSQSGAEVPTIWRRDEPQLLEGTAGAIQALSATDAYTAVLDDVGANSRLSCEGEWVTALDAADTRVIGETRAGTGVSDPPANERVLGGLPSYDGGTACEDTDDDGMPDAWERRYFDCTTCADPATAGRDGYLLVEHYLNGTDPR